MTIALQCPNSNSNLSEDDRNFILNLHNSARSNVAKGLEPNGPPSNNANVPGASNMYELVRISHVSWEQMTSSKVVVRGTG